MFKHAAAAAVAAGFEGQCDGGMLSRLCDWTVKQSWCFDACCRILAVGTGIPGATACLGSSCEPCWHCLPAILAPLPLKISRLQQPVVQPLCSLCSLALLYAV